MHDDHLLVEQRLRRVLDTRVNPAAYSRSVPLEVSVWHAPGEPVSVAAGISAPQMPARIGEPWGPPWGTSWFHFRGRVPTEWAGQIVEAVVDVGFDVRRTGFHAEGLVYSPDGKPIKGLNPRTQWVPISKACSGGEEVDFFVEVASNPMILGHDGLDYEPTVLGDLATAGNDPLYRLERAELALFDDEVWELARDLEVLGQLMLELSLDSPRRWELLRTLERGLDALDLDDISGTAAAARVVLSPALDAPAQASAHRMSAVGHAHIDSAWLWPIRETVRKVARTTANVVDLMDRHPDFMFAMSSAQQFAWIKEHRPEVYARVKQKVESGQFVPVGGMWVESDTNMPGGEALARQFVYGKQFFLEEFGIETQEVWLPDSFGYSAALPQLVKLSGSRWFLTQKISWSKVNKFPHHTFLWEGLDGTQTFTHFPPIDTYNAELTAAELAHASRNFADKGNAHRSLVLFGHGDGGGGPTREMLARATRLRDLEGSPRIEIEKPADFFTKAELDYQDPPIWVGELYLETHRGTFTSQARTKQGNRRSESLLREAELWASTAAVLADAPYPYDELAAIWKTVLLHQFHDILPGSSIAWVHSDAEATYAAVGAELEALIGTALHSLVPETVASETVVPTKTAGAGSGGHTTFNAAPHARNGVPALGAAVRSASAQPEVLLVDEGEDGWVLDNGLLRVRVDRRGLVVSVYDLGAERESLAPGCLGNLLQIHPDLPNEYDAWDVDAFYRNSVTDLVMADDVYADEEYADGVYSDDTRPDQVSVTVVRNFGGSAATQVMSLARGAGRVDVDTVVDWHEREKLLKVAWPLDIRADRSASEIQFGHVFRATHSNTSWDAAKFEICAHRWLQVAEPGYGIAVVNDSTYGHDVSHQVRHDGGTTTTVRLSLLRAPRCPDPGTDQGHHRLRYALVPGADVVDAAREGYRINLPERSLPGDVRVEPLVSVADDGVIVEAIKLAEDRSGDVIVRLYEAGGRRVRTELAVSFPVTRVWQTDLLERPLPDAPAYALDDATTDLELRPFQIVTLRLSR
jgi:alpha-mannosidase